VVLVDVLALVAHVDRLPVVAPAVARITRYEHVRQEVHLDLDHAVALARLAAPALDVEAEPARRVAAGARFLGRGEELADRREEARVRRRIRARRAADRALADVDHAVDVLEPLHRGDGRRIPAALVAP